MQDLSLRFLGNDVADPESEFERLRSQRQDLSKQRKGATKHLRTAERKKARITAESNKPCHRRPCATSYQPRE